MLELQETTTQQGGKEFGGALSRAAWLRDAVADRADTERRCGTVADWDGLWPDHAPGLSSLTHPATGRQTLGEPSVGFYGDLGVLYRQRGAQSQAIVEQLVDSGGEYAPIIDHALVADFNLNLSDQYAEMSNAQYWQDFSQNLGADFGALASLYDSVAQQNADLAAGHEQLALAAHNAYDHGLLVFDGVIQDQSFVYDALGNLTDRHDDAIDLAESFQYDVLNRVTGHSRSGQGAAFYELASLASITFQYDALGNLTHRSDTGSYAYGTRAGPHAVTAISGTETYHKNATYTYDANGNQLGGDGRTLEWASFNKPGQITRAGVNVVMAYGPERQLYRQVESDGSQTRTITTIGGLYEKETVGTQTTHRYHVAVGGEVMAVLVDASDELPEAHYFHRDHHSSIVAVTDKNGYVIERYHYDAFGDRHRALAGDDDPVGNLLNTVTDRGYTGHRHMAGIGLINMNGRLYDATIGRFISADPFIQAPLLSQSYNRYSYVLNNPLKLVDPSGYFFGFLKKIYKKVKRIVKKVASIINDVVVKAVKFVKKYWRPIAAVAIAVAVPYVAPQAFQAIGATGLIQTAGGKLALSLGGKVVAGAIGGGLAGFAATGSLKGFAYGALSGAAFATVGNISAIKGWATGSLNKVVAHGLTGSAMNVVRGKDFVKGFVSSGFTQFMAPVTAGIGGGGFGSRFLRVATAGGIGGVSSEIAGGKFQDGFVNGAAAQAFNEHLHPNAFDKKGIRPSHAQNRDPMGHYYTNRTYLCDIGSDLCTYDNKMLKLRANAAPGTTKPVLTGEITNTPGSSGVRHEVDLENYIVKNITLPGHPFHSGEVVRMLTVEGGRMYVDTLGYGTGANPGLNEHVGPSIFRNLDYNVRYEMGPLFDFGG